MAKKVTKKKTETKKKAPTKTRTAAAKAAKTVAAAPPAKPRATRTVTDEQIRMRAFEIYRAGRNPSNPDADWLQAEQELTAGLVSR